MKRTTEEDSSTVEWLNQHFDNLKLTFSEELEKLENDINSVSIETHLDDEFYEHFTIPDTNNEDNESDNEVSSNAESQPVYAGANITAAISMLLIMT